MRSLLVSGLLGLASFGVIATTPDQASAQPWRNWNTYYWTNAYWSPDYYYSPSAYSYSPVTYYAPYYVNPYYAYFPPPSAYEPGEASAYLPLRSTPAGTQPSEVRPAAGSAYLLRSTPTTPSEIRPAAATMPAADLVSISMQDDSFSPVEITVSPGTTVRWNNEGRRVHTVTSDKGLFNSQDLNPGEAFSFTFNRAGTYSYHCKQHSKTMRGTVTVR